MKVDKTATFSVKTDLGIPIEFVFLNGNLISIQSRDELDRRFTVTPKEYISLLHKADEILGLVKDAIEKTK